MLTAHIHAPAGLNIELDFLLLNVFDQEIDSIRVAQSLELVGRHIVQTFLEILVNP